MVSGIWVQFKAGECVVRLDWAMASRSDLLTGRPQGRLFHARVVKYAHANQDQDTAQDTQTSRQSRQRDGQGAASKSCARTAPSKIGSEKNRQPRKIHPSEKEEHRQEEKVQIGQKAGLGHSRFSRMLAGGKNCTGYRYGEPRALDIHPARQLVSAAQLKWVERAIGLPHGRQRGLVGGKSGDGGAVGGTDAAERGDVRATRSLHL